MVFVSYGYKNILTVAPFCNRIDYEQVNYVWGPWFGCYLPGQVTPDPLTLQTIA